MRFNILEDCKVSIRYVYGILGTESDIQIAQGPLLFSSLHLSIKLKLETPSTLGSSSVYIKNNQLIQQFLGTVSPLHLLFHGLLAWTTIVTLGRISTSLDLYHLLCVYRLGLLVNIEKLNS